MSELEIWKQIPEWPNYEVSNIGRVRRMRDGKLLKLQKNGKGYWSVGVSHHGKSKLRPVHTLVIQAFVGLRPPGMDTAHEDGDKLNNNASNLSYKTRKENVEDMRKHGTLRFGEKVIGSIFTTDQVREIRRRYDAVPKEIRRGFVKKLSHEYGVKLSTMFSITNRINWKHI